MGDEPTNIIRDEKMTPQADRARRGQVGMIRFTCSNGHSIVVPAKLAGKRGTCSRCGIDVVIPLSSTGGLPVSEGQGAIASPAAAEAIDFTGIEPTVAGDGTQAMETFEGLAAAVNEGVASGPAGPSSTGAAEIDGIDNPTAVLVAKLFGVGESGGVVELHLKSGQIVMPLLYDFTWSRGTHGVFAAENKSDNTITLMAVAWDSVEQVIVRKVRGLPEGMFE